MSAFSDALAVCATAYADDRLTKWEDGFFDDLLERQGVDDINDIDESQLSVKQLQIVYGVAADQ